MAESSSGRFVQGAVVIAFAASIVVLGVGEMRGGKPQSVSRKVTGTKAAILKGHGGKQELVRVRDKTGEDKKTLMGLRSQPESDFRASISRQAVKESSGKSSKNSERSIFSSLFPALGRKTVAEHSDNLSSEDRRQLNELLIKVTK